MDVEVWRGVKGRDAERIGLDSIIRLVRGASAAV